MVELRLGKLRRRLAQDLVGLTQFAVLTLQLFDLRAVLRRRAAAQTLVPPGLPDPDPLENLFFKLKDWRRIAIRYDGCADIFMGAVTLAATVIFWLRN